MSKVAAPKIWRQHVGIKVTQPLDVIIPTTRMEIVVALATNFIKGGVLIGSTTNWNYGLKGVSTGRTLSRSLGILVATNKVVGTPQVVFTNPIMTTFVNRTTNQPLMNSITIERYRSTDVGNLGRGYRKASGITTRIPNNRNGHSMRPNMVALKYPDFKKC
jgi:hypothetical protein